MTDKIYKDCDDFLTTAKVDLPPRSIPPEILKVMHKIWKASQDNAAARWDKEKAELIERMKHCYCCRNQSSCSQWRCDVGDIDYNCEDLDKFKMKDFISNKKLEENECCVDCEEIFNDPEYEGHGGDPREVYYEGHHVCGKENPRVYIKNGQPHAT